jgi:hypothetical protein
MTPKNMPTPKVDRHERHFLLTRDEADHDKSVRVFTSYSAALKAGQQECGHGKFWVQSEFQRGERWVDFAPDTSPLLG